MNRRNLLILLTTVMITALGLSACGTEPIHKKIEPAEVIPQGDDRNLVILTERAAQRLDIQIDTIGEDQIVQTHDVGGEVMIEAGSPEKAVVRVSFRPDELALIDQSVPTHVFPLNVDDNEDDDDEDDEGEGLMAELDELLGLDDDEDDREVVQYYVVKQEKHGLINGQKLLVEFPMKVDAEPQLVVSAAAVIYDVNGLTWIYTNPEPLTYLRVQIVVDYFLDDIAVLLEGPPVGTKVVTVGVAELHGIDTGVGK
jgi:hypothetical protein